MNTRLFRSALLQGVFEGALLFVAPLRPRFWKAVMHRGVAAAVAETTRPRRGRRER